MPQLKNLEHEMFAREIARGATNLAAWETIGYSTEKKHNAECASNRVARRPEVQARILELREATVQKTVKKVNLTREWVIAELVDNVQRCKQAEPVLDTEGKPTGEYRFNPAAANRALELLGKEIGLFVERSEQTRKFASIDDLLASQDEAWLRREIERRKAELAMQQQQEPAGFLPPPDDPEQEHRAN